MTFPWGQVAQVGIPMLTSLFGGKRSAEREIPGLAQSMAQTLAARRDAQMFARSAADPTSAWFRGLSGVLEEDFINQAFRAMRERDIRTMRKVGRGIPISMVTNPERRDEARYGAWIDALQRAKMTANTMTPQMLLNASSATGATAIDPSNMFRMYSAYGDTAATRRTDIGQGIGNLLGIILKRDDEQERGEWE